MSLILKVSLLYGTRVSMIMYACMKEVHETCFFKLLVLKVVQNNQVRGIKTAACTNQRKSKCDTDLNWERVSYKLFFFSIFVIG